MASDNLIFEDGYYTKRPVSVRVQQYRPGKPLPDGVCTGECLGRYTDPTAPHIHTLEGSMDVTDYDLIITGIKGERYPCKADIFQGSYDTENFVPEHFNAASGNNAAPIS